MKFLILGCNGMAGHMISIYLQERGHKVIGFARKKSSVIKTVVGDARDIEFLKQTIEKGKYDVVVNAIGVLNQFAEGDHENAIFLNAYLPQYLAKITQGMSTKIIHMSTDCVFSGTKGNYTENDILDGRTFYDRSKALGELVDEKNVTLRNSIIGPDINATGIGLMNWFLQQENTVKGYTRAMWTGQTTLQLAKTIEKMADQKIHGLFHMVPEDNISKYDLLVLLNKYIRSTPISIVEDEHFIVDKSLIRTNYEGFSEQIPGYEQQIQELGMWMREHKELYPHYEL